MVFSDNAVSASSMLGPTADQTESSLTSTNGTEQNATASSSQSSKKPSWLSIFSRCTNKERKNTGLAINLIDVPYVSIRTMTSSTLPTPRYPSEPILTNMNTIFLEAFEDAIRQCPDWRKRFLMKANEPYDQELAPTPLIKQECRLSWWRFERSWKGNFIQGWDGRVTFDIPERAHRELIRMPRSTQKVACQLFTFDEVRVVIVLEPVKVVDDRKGKERYDLPFSLYNYQDIVFAPQYL